MKIKDLLEENHDILYDVARHLEVEAWSGDYEFREADHGIQRGKVFFPDEDLEMNITLSHEDENILIQLSYEANTVDLGSMIDDDNPEAAALKAKLANRKKKPKLETHEESFSIKGRTLAGIAAKIEEAVDTIYMEMPREEM